MAHYRAVIRALRQRGLEPIVTLHHFTNPIWFARRGGWVCRNSVQLFARYADYVVTHLGADVTYWLTLNEPTVYVMQGYINGEWPPFARMAWRQALLVCRHLARAHVAAYRVLHQRRPGVRVGFAHNASYVMPCHPTRRRDRVAAALRDWVLNHAFLRLLGMRFRDVSHQTKYLDRIGKCIFPIPEVPISQG